MPIVTVFYVLANLSYFVVIPAEEIIASNAVAVVRPTTTQQQIFNLYMYHILLNYYACIHLPSPSDIRNEIIQLAKMGYSAIRFRIDVRQFKRYHFRSSTNYWNRRQWTPITSFIRFPALQITNAHSRTSFRGTTLPFNINYTIILMFFFLLFFLYSALLRWF